MLDIRNIVMENNSFDGLINRMNKTESFCGQVFITHCSLAILGGRLRLKICSSLEEAVRVRGTQRRQAAVKMR